MPRPDPKVLDTPPSASPELPSIDARGLMCPLPVLRLQKALRSMTSGQRVEIVTTDPATASTFRAFCKDDGHRLVSHRHQQGQEGDWFVIEKGAEKTAPSR